MSTKKRGRTAKGESRPGDSAPWDRTNQDSVFFLRQYEECVDQDELKKGKVVFRKDLFEDPDQIHPEKVPRVNINIYKRLEEGFGRVKTAQTPGTWEEVNLRRNIKTLTDAYIKWKKKGKGKK